MDTIEVWMEQYGYLTLFVALMLEYIALPFPGELVMGFSGYLAYEGRLSWPLALSLAWAGTLVGMTVTYFIGRKLGYPFLVKIGPRIFLSPKNYETVSRYGGETLLYAAAVALFILSYRYVAHDPTNRLIHVKRESSSLKCHWLLMGALCSAVVMFMASIRVP
ncbi:DedA family protein [Cohnella zeiphila]|uniref:Alkaline phosphatase n=1 Tax=Cohnella zeiphila TaxID=2761120 RepID=A0A7X0SLE4_9BACL|nr:hypothetical protein [Cohnella zeiphila]MBB6732152.1 hypothetical protein [Cohnella zeiphila]